MPKSIQTVRVSLNVTVNIAEYEATYGVRSRLADDVKGYVLALVNGSPAAEEAGMFADLVGAARRDATPATLPVFATGDDRLDAFMREHWTPLDLIAARKRAVAHITKPTPLKPRQWTNDQRAMLGLFNEMAVKLWRERGHDVVIEGGSIMGDGSNVHVRVLPPVSGLA